MATIYVRKSGKDTNSGLTEALAKLTINGANAIAVASDTVDIGRGTWTETLELGKVSLVTYQGAGMFLTTIIGNLYTGTSVRQILRDLKVKPTSFVNIALRALDWEDVYYDGRDMPASAGTQFMGFNYAEIYSFTRCVFYKIDTGASIFFAMFSGSAELKFYSNTFYKSSNTWAFFYDYAGTNNKTILKNNIFSDGVNQTIYLFNNCTCATHTNNTYYNFCNYYNPPSWCSPAMALDATETHSGVSNNKPMFIDPEGGDLRLTYPSTCIGTGCAIP